MATFDDKSKNKELVEQQQALSSYLDALFRDMPVIDEPEPLPEEPKSTNSELFESTDSLLTTPSISQAPIAKPKPVLPVAEPPPPAPVSHLVERHLVKKIETAGIKEKQVEIASPPPEQPTIYQPDQDFQVLFFRLGKLNLAVPLEHLSGILKVGEMTITKVPGYASWHMGLMKNQGVTVNVIDTAKLILPTHRQDVVEQQEPYRYFILLDGKRWGLACHTVSEVVTLQPDEVKWRKVRTLQPWLAGTVIEKMCALLDVEGFLQMLHQYNKN